MDHVYRWADGTSALSARLVGWFKEFERASVCPCVCACVSVWSQASADARTCG